MVLSLISDLALDFCTFSLLLSFFLFVVFSQCSNHRCRLWHGFFLNGYKVLYMTANRRATSSKRLVGDLFLCNSLPRFGYFKFCKNRLFSTFRMREKSQGRFYFSHQIALPLNTLLITPEVVQVMSSAFKPNWPSVSFTSPEFTTTCLNIQSL